MNRAAAQRFGHGPDPAPTPTGVATRVLRVAFDATPMLGPRTGIGGLVAALAQRLAADATIDLTGYVVSWRAADLRAGLPNGCGTLRMRLPARICHRVWRHIDWPRLSPGFDVVHGTNYVVPPLGQTEAVSLVSVHDLTSWRYPELVDRYSRANPRLLQRALDRGAHIHTGAHAVAEEIRSLLGVEPERIHVVVNGFDRTPPGDGASGRSLIGAPYVLAIGTIEPRKDYVGLLEAMTEVWSVHPDLRLAVVGGDGWGVDAFNRAARRLGAADRLVRCGYVSQQTKADLIAGAELLAYPSVYEGFGLPVLEAMDGGLPVVSTRVPAIAEVAGDAALLVPARSPTDLARAIVSVLDSDQLRSDLRRRGHERCRRYSWDTAAVELADLYRRLASPG